MTGGDKKLSFGCSPGCFPRATRRGRGEDIMRKINGVNEHHNGSCIFELLATVAGQLLKDQKDEGPSRRNPESPRNYQNSSNANNGVDCKKQHVAASSTCFPDQGLDETAANCAEDDDETTRISTDLLSLKHEYSRSKSTRVSTDLLSLKDEYSLSKGAGASTDLQCFNHNLPPLKTEVLDDYSMISCLDNPRLSTIVSDFKSKKRKSPEEPSLSRKEASLHLFIKPENFENKIRQCPNTAGTCSLSTAKTNIIVDRKDVTSHREEINLMIQNSFHVVDAESPPLVSSGSSDETAFPMEPTSDSATAVESRQRDVGFQSFSKSSNKFVKAKRLVTDQSKNGQSTAAIKRKHQMMKEKENVDKDETIRSSIARTSKKTSRITENRIEQSIFPPINNVIDTENVNPGPAPKKIQEDSELTSSFPAVSSALKPIAKKSGDHVKFSINSFLVPELLVDLPASATIANLKKAVMDAAMNLIGGGLCVRVLLQGKKVVDESESLLQAGISNGGMLGFMLEPESKPSTTSFENGVLVHSLGNNLRYPVQSKDKEVTAGTSHISASEGLIDVHAPNSGGRQSTTIISSKQDMCMHDGNQTVIPNSSALILHPSEVNDGPNSLAVIPFDQSAVVKRRMRRPFTVTEVEVLVQAVEKLGTGRWRDVKLHAFPHAKHRTYVDLKDKWKTLVHTASIAPHQRRGEPVPQGLLDRVIQAHSYWTAQQAKQQPLETKMI